MDSLGRTFSHIVTVMSVQEFAHDAKLVVDVEKGHDIIQKGVGDLQGVNIRNKMKVKNKRWIVVSYDKYYSFKSNQLGGKKVGRQTC